MGPDRTLAALEVDRTAEQLLEDRKEPNDDVSSSSSLCLVALGGNWSIRETDRALTILGAAGRTVDASSFFDVRLSMAIWMTSIECRTVGRALSPSASTCSDLDPSLLEWDEDLSLRPREEEVFSDDSRLDGFPPASVGRSLTTRCRSDETDFPWAFVFGTLCGEREFSSADSVWLEFSNENVEIFFDLELTSSTDDASPPLCSSSKKLSIRGDILLQQGAGRH